jgi:hypothetical protein
MTQWTLNGKIVVEDNLTQNDDAIKGKNSKFGDSN